jgi:hypothetical protein
VTHVAVRIAAAVIDEIKSFMGFLSSSPSCNLQRREKFNPVHQERLALV